MSVLPFVRKQRHGIISLTLPVSFVLLIPFLKIRVSMITVSALRFLGSGCSGRELQPDMLSCRDLKNIYL